MAVRFGLTYELRIEDAEGSIIIIRPPLSIEFDIYRNLFSSINICMIRIYNLAESTRNKLRFSISNVGTFRSIELAAGYESSGNSLTSIFSGNITQAYSARQRVDYLTQIDCRAGGFALANSTISRTYGAGTSKKDIVRDIISSLPKIAPGAIGNFNESLSRSNSYFGSSVSILQELTGGCFFIDNGYGHAIRNDEYIDKGTPLIITPASGLLETPILEQYTVRFDMIFEPAMGPGELIKIDSSESFFNNSGTRKTYDGEYKILGVRHKGMIGGRSSKVVTTGEFQFSKVINPVSV